MKAQKQIKQDKIVYENLEMRNTFLTDTGISKATFKKTYSNINK